MYDAIANELIKLVFTVPQKSGQTVIKTSCLISLKANFRRKAIIMTFRPEKWPLLVESVISKRLY